MIGVRRAGPDADLSHLPVSLDLRAINLAEGVRAALSVAAIVAFNEWADIPALAEAALGALLTCLCDPGGPIRRRAPTLLAFAVLGSVITACFGLLRPLGLPVAIPCTCLLIFCTMLARIWGQPAMQVGNLLTVVTILALDRGEDLHTSLVVAGMFMAGSLWALLLTLVIWRIHPFRPGRRAVAEVFRRLTVLARDLSALIGEARLDAGWADHARAHRRYVRDGIEQARGIVLDIIRTRGQGTLRANQMVIQVEAADQLFGAMIALSDVLEHNTAVRTAASHQLPALRLLFAAIADATAADLPSDDPTRRATVDQLLAQVATGRDSPALAGITTALLDRLRIAALLTTPEGYAPDGEVASAPRQRAARVFATLRANLVWSSAGLRHAVRAAAVAAPALVITLSSGEVYAHWLTITLVLTLQPFFALTWQRALERVGGTMLGGIVAAAIATLVHGPLAIAAALFPLAVLAFTVRAVSFGLFMVFLTPLVVLLSEVARPGESEFVIAAFRMGFTALGGVLAVLGGIVLWPSWEPSRVAAELRAAIGAHAAFADLELAALQGAPDIVALHAARRAAGVASNNLEASLSRALQEPRRVARTELKSAMVADAALRRMAGRLSALQHQPSLAGTSDLEAWRSWLARAFWALGEAEPLPGDPPADTPAGSLARIARQIELMDGALRPA